MDDYWHNDVKKGVGVGHHCKKNVKGAVSGTTVYRISEMYRNRHHCKKDVKNVLYQVPLQRGCQECAVSGTTVKKNG
ncbi:hypothetical protein CHS0354_029956 [Potamilus streckersoni]|uniref:Uncharacterized protein n=1 Tax=Potamilus streckersoni TaxID=2493646 RepID=A0AAE0SEN2_9BIVA|nr:hypothetical protein CHS0354_029956 [Potamilus streckersoni]